MSMLHLPSPYLIFLGDLTDRPFGKTAFGLRDWAPERCVGEYALPSATVTSGLPKLTPAQAAAQGARAMVIGVASIGGKLSPAWLPALVEALEAGLDLINGLHMRLEHVPELQKVAERTGRKLIDVRIPPSNLPVGNGRKRGGKRLLTVGTDCALGKKYTALALTRAFKARGVAADFRATGQTGILIAGAGIPIDAVVSDFVAGAAESISPEASADHWDVVEGQGSVFHPSYAGVSLGLLHGSQPDVLVLCHEAGRSRLMGLDHYAVPSLEEAIELHERLARRTNPAARCAGISLNTSGFSPTEASAVLAEESKRIALPVADPIRGGPAFDQLVDACLNG